MNLNESNMEDIAYAFQEKIYKVCEEKFGTKDNKKTIFSSSRLRVSRVLTSIRTAKKLTRKHFNSQIFPLVKNKN